MPGHLHFVVPGGIDDPRRPSGGNHYDLRSSDALRAAGWTVEEQRVDGSWPEPSAGDELGLADVLERVPDGAQLLLDGLVASAAPAVVGAATTRLRIAVLVHLPLGLASVERRPAEAALLRGVAVVVTTSRWTRRWLLEHYALEGRRVRTARPGTDRAHVAPGTPDGAELLCVGAVTEVKGQDVLLDALARLQDLAWRCTCVGAIDVQPELVERLRSTAAAAGLSDRFVLAGPRTGPGLDTAYAEADLVVVPSRVETYGMVVGEALARGLPVVAARVGGVPESLGHTADRRRPGLLVPPEDPAALARALRKWLGHAGLRDDLRSRAGHRRTTLPTWEDTAAELAAALGPDAEPSPQQPRRHHQGQERDERSGRHQAANR